MYMSAMIKTPKIYWLLISIINDETLPNKRKSSQLEGQREAPKKKKKRNIVQQRVITHKHKSTKWGLQKSNLKVLNL
jgi:P2-related tail formation protein